MNCQCFKIIVDDLACDRELDSATRASGRAHAEDCDECAARLADQQSLTTTLRSLATATATTSAEHRVQVAAAAARIEAKLCQAFREHHEARRNHEQNHSASPRRLTAITAPAYKAVHHHHHHWRLAAAAAAAVVMLIAVAIASLLHQRSLPPHTPPSTSKQTLATRSLHQSPSTAEETGTESESSAATHQLAASQVGSERRVAESEREMIVRQPVPQRAANQKRYNARRTGNPKSDDMAASITRDAQAGTNLTNADADETATEFISLMNESTLAPLESGQVVRVRLPRSALATLGLPMNIERAGEPITADVLFGEDGLARAIRFVQ